MVTVVHLRARRVYCRQANEAQSVQATWRGCLNEGQDPNGWYRRPGRHPWVSPCGADGTSSRRALAEGDAAVTVRGVGQTPTLRGAAMASVPPSAPPLPEGRRGGPRWGQASALAEGNRSPVPCQREPLPLPPDGRPTLTPRSPADGTSPLPSPYRHRTTAPPTPEPPATRTHEGGTLGKKCH